MESITIKLEEGFLHLMENIMKRNQYTTKTEFIREAIRDKINALETKAALRRVEKMYGAGAKKYGHITDEDLHRVREEAARELAEELGVKLD